MTLDITHKFETNNKFIALLLPAVFLPLYYDADINIVFKILIYIIPAWFLIAIDTNKMVIYNDHIFYTKYTKPFTKTYNIPLHDIEKVIVTRITMSVKISPALVIYSKSLRKKFRVSIFRGIDEDLCKFFVDKKIKVETNNSELNNFILHYINDKRKK